MFHNHPKYESIKIYFKMMILGATELAKLALFCGRSTFGGSTLYIVRRKWRSETGIGKHGFTLLSHFPVFFKRGQAKVFRSEFDIIIVDNNQEYVFLSR